MIYTTSTYFRVFHGGVFMDIYICPMCGYENPEHQKYCIQCRKWLLDPNFPSKKKERSKKDDKTNKAIVVVVCVLCFIGIVGHFIGNSDSYVVGKHIETINIHPYTFSQLKITPGIKTSIPVDFTVHEDLVDPLEIVAVFYDKDGNRIGRASTIFARRLSAGQTTTLNLKLDEPVNLMPADSVRMEVVALSPFEFLIKTNEELDDNTI